MFRSRFLLILLVFLLGFMACSEDPDLLYSKAETEARLGSRQRALNYLLQIQASQPGYTEAYVFAADLFMDDDNFPEAIAQLKRGLDARADSTRLLYKIGTLYQRGGDLDNAARYYQSALELDPQNGPADVSMGQVLLAKDLYDRAIVHFDKALQNNPGNYDARLGKSMALTRLDDTGLAIEILEKTIEENSMAGEAYGYLAYTQEQTGVEREAIQENYSIAVRLSPENQDIWQHYLDFVAADSNLQAAIEIHQAYNQLFKKDLDGYHRLASLYLDLAMQEGLSWLDAAKNQCDQALLLDDDDAVSHGNLARIYLLQQKPRLAILEAQLAFEIHPSSEYRELVDRAQIKME